MRVLIVEPQKAPYVSKMANTLDAMQETVGGNIEAVTLEDDVCLYCNEEGKLENLPLNRSVGSDIICGTFFICGQDDEGDSVSLTDWQIEKYSQRFAEPENFAFGFGENDIAVSVVGFPSGYDYADTCEDEDEDDLEL